MKILLCQKNGLEVQIAFLLMDVWRHLDRPRKTAVHLETSRLVRYQFIESCLERTFGSVGVQSFKSLHNTTCRKNQSLALHEFDMRCACFR